MGRFEAMGLAPHQLLPCDPYPIHDTQHSCPTRGQGLLTCPLRCLDQQTDNQTRGPHPRQSPRKPHGNHSWDSQTLRAQLVLEPHQGVGGGRRVTEEGHAWPGVRRANEKASASLLSEIPQPAFAGPWTNRVSRPSSHVHGPPLSARPYPALPPRLTAGPRCNLRAAHTPPFSKAPSSSPSLRWDAAWCRLSCLLHK